MKRRPATFILFCFGALAVSCNGNSDADEASGTFEATETMISSEIGGKILELNIEEGDQIMEGQKVGCIDSTQLYYSKLQLLQNQKAILSGRPDSRSQLETLQRELVNAENDRMRIENLVKGGVSSQKQLDDAVSRVAVLQSRIDALSKSLSTATATINEQSGTVAVQLAQVEDQLRKCNIINPVNGTVLNKFAKVHEMTAAGKPLYNIADLSEMILRAYITADQFARVKIGDKVRVSVDAGEGESKLYNGVVEWINRRAEFTPKTIQTKDERANLVYAIKIKVQNDGFIKIGMYGGAIF